MDSVNDDCVRLHTIVYDFVRLCTIVYECVRICTIVYDCVRMYTNMYDCVRITVTLKINRFSNGKGVLERFPTWRLAKLRGERHCIEVKRKKRINVRRIVRPTIISVRLVISACVTLSPELSEGQP